MTISIHAPRGGSDEKSRFTDKSYTISIHAPRGGSDHGLQHLLGGGVNFNPRSPWGERLLVSSRSLIACRFQSTLPVGGATYPGDILRPVQVISIHAPRGGSDGPVAEHQETSHHFNPRSPWGERPFSPVSISCSTVFQSTLPVGGATGRAAYPRRPLQRFQSTLPVGGATRRWEYQQDHLSISIHAPRGGSDAAGQKGSGKNQRFQSTLPVGGAT